MQPHPPLARDWECFGSQSLYLELDADPKSDLSALLHPNPTLLAYGVLKGSFLSSMLFNFDMKPLGDVVRGFTLRYHQ